MTPDKSDIIKQNFADVSRNVGACQIPRFAARLFEQYMIDVAFSEEAWLIESVREITTGSMRFDRSAGEKLDLNFGNQTKEVRRPIQAAWR